jgi:hypothetical protein
MPSERPPIQSNVERVRRENRFNAPKGFGTSFVVHVCIALLFGSAATAVYVEVKTPQVQEQQNQVITIETLVRPQTAVQRPQTQQRMVVQQMERVSPSQTTQVTQRTATANASLPVAKTVAQTPETQTSSLNTLQTMSGGHGKHHQKRKPAQQSSARPAVTARAPAAAGDQAPTNGANVYTAPGNGDTRSDDEAAGGYMSPGQGPVWSEHAPGGGGHGGDSCAPSRGGFISAHHRLSPVSMAQYLLHA